MRNIVFWFCTLTVAFFAASPSNSEGKGLSLFTGQSTVRIHSTLDLPQNAREAFSSTFRHQKYYAAFAVSPSGVFHQMAQYNDINSAYRDALRMCRALLLPGEEDCSIYASIVPRDYRESDGITLSEATTDFYKSYRSQPGHKAFVINSR